MTKVCVIGSENACDFEKSVNIFIKNKKVIDIKYQALLAPKVYTNGVSTKSTVFDRALIIYEED